MPGEPALLHGGPLPAPPVATLGEALARAARGTRGMVLLDAGGNASHRSYAQLYDDAARALAALRAAGAVPGQTVILRPAHPADLLTVFWACVLGGLAPLPLPPGGADEALADAHRAVGTAWLTGDEEPDTVPRGLRWLGRPGTLRAPAPDLARHPARPEDLAALTLTSGSSGRPKAVPLTHRNILSRAHATALVRGLDEHTRTLNWMPLDHVSGIVMFHVRDVFLTCHQVHADTGWVRADPLRWLDVAAAEHVDTTWAPNHAFALVADRLDEPVDRSWDLSGLRYIMNGGEAVKDRVAHRFVAALSRYGLPATAVHPGWGMPETASGVVDSVFSPHGGPFRRFVPVGMPHPGVSLRVVDEKDQLLPERAVGRLQVTGLPVAGGFLEGGVYRRAPLTADGWLVTDDLAFVDAGEVTVTGRADDVIEVAGARYHSHEIEEAVEELACVTPSSTVARGLPGAPGRLAVFFRPRPEFPVPQAEGLVREKVRSRFGATVEHLEALTEDELPRTATGKLRKSALSARLPG
ncbi:AMP-binding protein [Streptomyces sp. NBC_01317]|uniref:AMP-binding protein n=1 Tax=Streptomyces sp. NBC_01317 TaxID=2903822 RepID=UPI002E0F2ED5|nr:AMP-binding protein [Streptomyces sp. NBC_01317]